MTGVTSGFSWESGGRKTTDDDTKETVGVTIQYRDVMGQGSLLLTPEQLIEHTAKCLARIDGGREAVIHAKDAVAVQSSTSALNSYKFLHRLLEAMPEPTDD